MFRDQVSQRITAIGVLITFTSLLLQPLTAAAQAKSVIEDAKAFSELKTSQLTASAKRDSKKSMMASAPEQKAEKRLENLLIDVEENVKKAKPDAFKGASATLPPAVKNVLPAVEVKNIAKKIQEKAFEIKSVFVDVEKGFSDTELQLRNAKMSNEVIVRHTNMVAEYNRRKAEFGQISDLLSQAIAKDESAALDDALEKLASFSKKYPNAKPHQFTDPNRLAFRLSDRGVRPPFQSKSQFQAGLFPPKYEKVLLAGAVPDGLTLAQVALPNAPTPQDTSETDDIQITQAIKDLASQLNKNPVEIFNWVKNNIDFMPTYGAIQNADRTLLNKRGNAFDTASLLIALYRASGIPARYVYGTIELPAEKVMNWVGGVSKPEAAQSLLMQGGIPSSGITGGGTVQSIRMEHVWVEAFVDYLPSRGAKNKNPQTWVPLDASFKQYEFSPKANLAKDIGIDTNAYQQALLKSAVVDMGGNRITGDGSADIAELLESDIGKGKSWAMSTGMALALNILQGKKNIKQSNQPILFGTLPYAVVVEGNKFQSIPANLRWTINVGYFSSDSDFLIGNAVFSHTISLAKLGNQKLGLSYVPATAADAETIQSLQSQNATSLPAYLVNGIPRLSLDSSLLIQGAPVQFGRPQIVTVSITDPQGQHTNVSTYNVTAGDETTFVVNPTGINQKTITERFAQFASNTSSENLHTVGNVYWALQDLGNEIAAATHNVVSVRLPSVGAFGAPLTTQYFFGIPRSGYFQNRYADVKNHSIAAVTTDGKIPVDFMRTIGMQGSNAEGLAFDLTFSRERGTSGSTVRIMERLRQSGASVYRINSGNQYVLDTLAISEDVKIDIRNAITAGKEAIVPDRELAVNSWNGLGYILFDPLNGAGAYLIKGGYNGGVDQPDCAKEPSVVPLPDPVEEPNTLDASAMVALAIITIAAAAYSTYLAVGVILGWILTANFSIAAPSPLQKLPNRLVNTWRGNFGNVFGEWPSSAPAEIPRSCPGPVLAALEQEKKQLCDNKTLYPKNCNGEECAETTQIKMENRKNCILKRLEIMFTCYMPEGGTQGGDDVHWNHVQEELNGLRHCENCLKTTLKNQCKPGDDQGSN